MVVIVGIREILYVPPERLICRHHWKRFIVYVSSNTAFRHLFDDMVPCIGVDVRNTHQVQMVGTVHVRRVMDQMADLQLIAHRIVLVYYLSPALDKPRITVQLAKAYRGHYVRHVALVPGTDDIVFPGAELGLGKRILVLSVQRQELEHLVDLSVFYSADRKPGAGSAFCSRKVLYCMEREARKVRNGPAVLLLSAEHSGSAQAVSAVCYYRNSAQRSLYPGGKVSQCRAVAL